MFLRDVERADQENTGDYFGSGVHDRRHLGFTALECKSFAGKGRYKQRCLYGDSRALMSD